jgi:hypothetical protein
VGFFWEDSFKFEEKIIIDKQDVFKDLEEFVKSEKKKMNFGERVLNGVLYFIPALLLTAILSPNARRRKYRL